MEWSAEGPNRITRLKGYLRSRIYVIPGRQLTPNSCALHAHCQYVGQCGKSSPQARKAVSIYRTVDKVYTEPFCKLHGPL